MKKILVQGLIAGLLSAVAGVVYLKMYEGTTMIDFSTIINSTAVVSSSIIGCMLMSLGYLLIFKLNKMNWKGALNLLIILLSFLSILGPISMSLPLDFDFPEMFPGLVIPMHFFPAMIFFGIAPFFKQKIA